MGLNIDESIVKMGFDNREFERGAKESISTLDSLRKSLDFRGVNSNIALDGIATAMQSIDRRFSAIGVSGMALIQNLTNSAIAAAKNVAKAFTIDPVKTGFSEYETQINAVQTILANTKSKGTTLDDVNKALDTLNTYADKTIYNFTEMTRNIGTFTAAGIDLDTSVTAIQGIANLAAVSGSTSQQASTAMYQLSQALSSGTVKLQDWNSVVNAGMGGQVFQDALKETARAHGVAVDDLIEKEGSFRESLKHGWITADLLTETLSKFTMTTEGLTEAEIEQNREMLRGKGYTEEQIDAIFELGKTATDAATKVKTFTQLMDTLKEAAQSGWTQSWEIIVGDFEEAKKLFTDISNEMGAVIGASAEARNKVLQGWKDDGGREAMIDGFRNLYGVLRDIINPAKEAFREFFPAKTAKDLLDFTNKFKDFSEQLHTMLSSTSIVKTTFSSVFESIQNAIEIVKYVLKSAKEAFDELIPKPTLNDIAAVAASIKNMTGKFKDFLIESDSTKRIIKGIVAGFSIARKIIMTFGKAIGRVAKVLKPLAVSLYDTAADIGDFVVSLNDAIDNSAALEFILDGITWAFDKMGDALKWVADKVGEAFTSLNDIDTSKLEGKFKPFEALAKAFDKACEKLKAVYDFIAPYFKKIKDGVKGFLDGLFEAFQNGDMQSIMQFVNTGLLGSLLVGIKKLISSATKVMKNSGKFVESFKEIMEGITDILSATQQKLKTESLKNLAVALLILAGSLAIIASIDSNKIGGSLTAIGAMFGELVGALKLASKTMKDVDGKTLGKISSGLIIMSVSVLVLAGAMKMLSTLDWDGIEKGLVAVTVLVGVILGAVFAFSKMQGAMISGAGGILGLAFAIGLLAFSVEKLGNMDLTALGQGLLGIIAILGALWLFFKITDLGNMGVSAGAGLMMMGAGLIFMSIALKILSTIPFEEMCVGMLAFIGALTMIAYVMYQMPNNMMAIGAGLIGIGIGLVAMATAIKILSTIGLPEMSVAMAGLAVTILVLVLALNALQNAIPAAGAMLIVSVALIGLAVALKLLSTIPIDKVGIALAALAGALLLVGGAAMLLGTGGAVALLALGGALIVFGLGIAALGASLLVLGAGLGAAGAGLAVFFTGIVNTVIGILMLFPKLIDVFTTTLVAIADVIGVGGVAIVEALAKLGTAILDALSDFSDQAKEKFGSVTGAVEAFSGALGALVLVALGLSVMGVGLSIAGIGLIAFGAGAATASVGVGLLAAAMGLLAGAVVDISDSFDKIGNAFETMGDISVREMKSARDKYEAAGREAGEAVIEAFSETISNTSESVSAMVNSMVTSFKSNISTLEKAGKDIVNALARGVKTNSDKAEKAAFDTGAAMKDTVQSFVSKFRSVGTNIVNGLIQGINARRNAAVTAAENLGTAVENATKNAVEVHSPSRAYRKIGMYLDMGLAEGLKQYSNLAVNAAGKVGESTLQPVTTIADDAKLSMDNMGNSIAKMGNDISSIGPVIREEKDVTVTHAFDTLHVEGVNSEGEFVAAADYSVEEVLTNLIRRQGRR